MSAKWRQVKAWDDQFLRGPFLWPVKFVLRAFSSITLAVILLLLVSLYGVLASIPVGLIALFPTVLLYGFTLVLVVTLLAVVPVLMLHLTTKGAWKKTPFGFIAVSCGFLVLTLVSIGLWYRFAWPQLVFDPATGSGVRFFAPFIKEYYSTTVRRMPGMEMSELEFYSWWPLRLILMLFVLNMVVATVRRIEFNFKNIGVLTVHTGIVIIALGSVYYSGLKREGDTVLLAGPVDETTGTPGPGQIQDVFYDNTRVALYVDTGKGWEQRPLVGLPRYNDYNLNAIPGRSAFEASRQRAPWAEATPRTLNLPVMHGPDDADHDVTFSIVGYCSFAKTQKDWIQESPPKSQPANPLRIVYLHSALPDLKGNVTDEPAFAFTLSPKVPASRISEEAGSISVEYTMGPDAGMTAERWSELSEPLPAGTLYALAITVPDLKNPDQSGKPLHRGVYPVAVGSKFEVGKTGYKVEVIDLQPEPTFPIITEGYKGATSSLARVIITPPTQSTLDPDHQDPYERYVYHRFPQINQDMLKELNARGMPARRNADPSIVVSLIDASQLNIYFDEPAADGKTRAVIRERGGKVRTVQDLGPSDRLNEVIDKISLSVGERWAHAREVERPYPASPQEQQEDKNSIGTHEKALMAVRVQVGSDPQQSSVIWVPFTRYFGVSSPAERVVDIEGRKIKLAFGRVQHQLPGFVLQLTDFQMISYDYRGSPRDYQSSVRVIPAGLDFEGYEHITKLNAPLTAPYLWDDSRPLFTNILQRLGAGLNPYQFKFSQSGWDAAGWQRSQAQVDAGTLKKPVASFTILGVGNSPGIHVVALGGVLMALGIPWAFYVKPYLVQREKRKIQSQLASGTYQPPQRHKPVSQPTSPQPAAMSAPPQTTTSA